ncbi:hypothetical protein DFQ30_010316 [Apophysomyces sp. BC1015]|nr:hypothetical protein DFQ30_010316 [Apophysomyces sp. BC1015]
MHISNSTTLFSPASISEILKIVAMTCCIDGSEINYNHRRIWPCLESIIELIDASSLDGVEFDSSEKQLYAMKRARNDHESTLYNADGIAYMTQEK